MSTVDRAAHFMLLALVACLPFELRSSPAFPSDLQILFVGLLLLSAPALIRERHALLSNRLVVAAAVFVVTAWIAALASSNLENAVKGAGRYSAGFILLCIAL